MFYTVFNSERKSSLDKKLYIFNRGKLIMKKSRLSSLAVAAIATVAVTAGLALAWFVTTEKPTGIDVSAGTIEIEATGFGFQATNDMLPGETYKIEGTSTNKGTIENVGSREAIVEVNVGSAFKGYITQEGLRHGASWDPIQAPGNFPGDYKATDDPNKGEFLFEASRLAQVAEASIDTAGTKWIEVNKNYYTRLDGSKTANSTHARSIDLVGLQITLLDELGGLVGQGAAETANRQFEQASYFELAFTIKAVQATNAAIADEFGTDVRDACVNAGFLN